MWKRRQYNSLFQKRRRRKRRTRRMRGTRKRRRMRRMRRRTRRTRKRTRRRKRKPRRMRGARKRRRMRTRRMMRMRRRTRRTRKRTRRRRRRRTMTEVRTQSGKNTPVTLALARWRQEGQEFKVTFSYNQSWRVIQTLSQKERKRKKSKGRVGKRGKKREKKVKRIQGQAGRMKTRSPKEMELEVCLSWSKPEGLSLVPGAHVGREKLSYDLHTHTQCMHVHVWNK